MDRKRDSEGYASEAISRELEKVRNLIASPEVADGLVKLATVITNNVKRKKLKRLSVLCGARMPYSRRVAG